MKVSREPRPFEPVVLTLESEAEVRLFIGLLGALSTSAAEEVIGSHMDVDRMHRDLMRVSGLENWYAFEFIRLHGSRI